MSFLYCPHCYYISLLLSLIASHQVPAVVCRLSVLMSVEWSYNREGNLHVESSRVQTLFCQQPSCRYHSPLLYIFIVFLHGFHVFWSVLILNWQLVGENTSSKLIPAEGFLPLTFSSHPVQLLVFLSCRR